MSDFKLFYSVDGVSLNDSVGRWFLEVSTSRRSLPAVRVTNVSTPRRHGDGFIPGDTFDSTRVGLSLIVTDKDALGVSGGAVQAERNLEYLTALFLRTDRLLRVVQHTGPSESRTALGRVTAAAEPTASTPLLDRYRLHFVLSIPSVFWSDPAGPVVSQGPAATVTGVLALPLLAGGSAPITDAIIRFKGPFNGVVAVSDPTSGAALSWEGTLTATQYVFLNADTLKAHISTSATAWTTGTDATSGLDYPPPGPLVLTPSALAGGVSYSLNYSRPAVLASADAVGVRAERRFL